MIGEFIRSKLKSALLFSVYLGVFCLVAFLFGMPFDALIYAIVLCLFFAAVFIIYSYARFRQRLAVLQDIKAKIQFGPEELPQPANAIEEEYQEIIKSLYRTTSAAVSAKDKAMSDMIEYYTLWAHQIKTPIAAIDLLLQSEPAGVYKDQFSMELFKVEQYVEMVLAYLRTSDMPSDFVFAQYDLDDLDKIIREVVKKHATIFIKKKISLDYQGVDAKTISDEKWLSFVLEQVLSNALKYTPSGKISIYMDEVLPCTLVVEDTGIGIQEEDLPRVFDKGYTGYNGRKDKKSTGIGLYLCSMIMNKLGHTLTIESQEGKGTKVKLGLGTYKTVRFE